MENTLWLIWSIEHDMWWRPNSRGYTSMRDEAGKYTYEEACKIVEGANYSLTVDPGKKYDRYYHTPHEAMILVTK